MAKQILIKPLITEKAELMTDNDQYAFVVNRKANKIEIKKAIEDMYGVTVDRVNTIVMPAKRKTRNTKSGLVRGRTSVFKKAYIKLVEGDEINFYQDI